jgi:hypothetical protein
LEELVKTFEKALDNKVKSKNINKFYPCVLLPKLSFGCAGRSRMAIDRETLSRDVPGHGGEKLK